MKFGQDGSIAQSWVHCDVQSADIVAHLDGTPVVSLIPLGDGEVKLALPR